MYERCYHLSLSFKGGTNKAATDTIITGLFGEDKKMIWIEPAYTDKGKQMNITHYRLFCNQLWQGIMPKGEVYSKEFTEAGWKSYSEVQNAKEYFESKIVDRWGENFKLP